jgi:hypothetical protein
VSSTKSASSLLSTVISVCNPLTKSATLNSIVLPFSNVNIIFLFSASYSQSTTTLSNGKSTVLAVHILLPSWSLSCVVITYVEELMDISRLAAYFVVSGIAPISLACVGTVIFIVLFEAWLVVNESIVSLFF